MKKSHLKSFFLSTIFLFIVRFLPGQTTLTVSNDTTICLGGSATLSAVVTGGSYGTSSYTFQTYAYSPQPFSGGTAVCADFSNCSSTAGGKDDCVSGPYPIGFNFCFFNHTYTQFWVGSNGWISFSQPPGFNLGYLYGNNNSEFSSKCSEKLYFLPMGGLVALQRDSPVSILLHYRILTKPEIGRLLFNYYIL